MSQARLGDRALAFAVGAGAPFALAVQGGGYDVVDHDPLYAPYYFLHDLVELGATLRAAIRYRSPML